ncbi:MAG TPA: DUF998 domain-containing protein [Candidatus Saccharimonadales bacterium]|nr:DUF998 domain-containing protein [Candidatus Saccharimonadales bacterium]
MKQKKTIYLTHQTRAALWVGVITPLLCIGIFTVDGATREHYDVWRQWISHLSLGERGWLGMANLAMTGIGLLAAAYGIKHAIVSGRRAKWPHRLVAAAGVGFIVASVFKQDPGLGYPPGVAASTGSVADSIHGVAALLLFGSLIALCFVSAKRYGRRWNIYSIVSAWVTIVAFVSCSVLVALDYSMVWAGAPSGFLERIALICVLVYVSALTCKLLKIKP